MEAVWNLTASQFNLHNYVAMAASGDYSEWVRLLVASGTKKEKKEKEQGLVSSSVLVASVEREE
jgi:hypothetical protein